MEPRTLTKRYTCPPGKMLNPFTGRCVLKNGQVGQKLLGDPSLLDAIKRRGVIRLKPWMIRYERNGGVLDGKIIGRQFRFDRPGADALKIIKRGKKTGTLVFRKGYEDKPFNRHYVF